MSFVSSCLRFISLSLLLTVADCQATELNDDYYHYSLRRNRSLGKQRKASSYAEDKILLHEDVVEVSEGLESSSVSDYAEHPAASELDVRSRHSNKFNKGSNIRKVMDLFDSLFKATPPEQQRNKYDLLPDSFMDDEWDYPIDTYYDDEIANSTYYDDEIANELGLSLIESDDPINSKLFGKAINYDPTILDLGDSSTQYNNDSDLDWIEERFNPGEVTGLSTRVVGGKDAPSTSAPFFAILLFWNFKTAEWEYMGCGGTLISNRHVLTAAHCVFDRKRSIDAVYVHAHQPFEGNPDTPFHFSRVKKYTIHPSFRDGPNDSDVAIITLSRSVNDRSSFPPIRLARPTNVINDGDVVSIYGFGRTSQNSNEEVHTLQVGTLPFISYKACKKYYRSSKILPDMVCGGFPTSGGIDACQGDSGGPMTFTRNKKVYQVGTVSWGEGCGLARRPGVYASIQYHFDWIQDVVCNEINEPQLCSTDDWDETISSGTTIKPETGNNGKANNDRSSSNNTTIGVEIDSSTIGAKVCNDSHKNDGEECRFGGECCSGRCSLNNDLDTRICQKNLSRRILYSNAVLKV